MERREEREERGEMRGKKSEERGEGKGMGKERKGELRGENEERRVGAKERGGGETGDERRKTVAGSDRRRKKGVASLPINSSPAGLQSKQPHFLTIAKMRWRQQMPH